MVALLAISIGVLIVLRFVLNAGGRQHRVLVSVMLGTAVAIYRVFETRDWAWAIEALKSLHGMKDTVPQVFARFALALDLIAVVIGTWCLWLALEPAGRAYMLRTWKREELRQAKWRALWDASGLLLGAAMAWFCTGERQAACYVGLMFASAGGIAYCDFRTGLDDSASLLSQNDNISVPAREEPLT